MLLTNLLEHNIFFSHADHNKWVTLSFKSAFFEWDIFIFRKLGAQLYGNIPLNIYNISEEFGPGDVVNGS